MPTRIVRTITKEHRHDKQASPRQEVHGGDHHSTGRKACRKVEGTRRRRKPVKARNFDVPKLPVNPAYRRPVCIVIMRLFVFPDLEELFLCWHFGGVCMGKCEEACMMEHWRVHVYGMHLHTDEAPGDCEDASYRTTSELLGTTSEPRLPGVTSHCKEFCLHILN